MFSRNIDQTGDDVFNFDTEFLEAQQVEIRWYDDQVVTLWNRTAHDLWHRFAPKGVLPAGKAVRERYARTLEAAVNAVEASYRKDVLSHKTELSRKLRKDSARILARPPPRVTFSQRIPGLVDSLGPLRDIRAHIKDVRSGGPVPPPPFSDPGSALPRRGE